MGTRSTTHLIENGKTIISFYKQFDGYIDGYGKDLYNFLKPMVVGNGISGDMKMGEFANRAECLALQYACHFKKDIGGFYLTTEDDRQEYDYFIDVKEGDALLFNLKVFNNDRLIFTGTIQQFGIKNKFNESEN